MKTQSKNSGHPARVVNSHIQSLSVLLSVSQFLLSFFHSPSSFPSFPPSPLYSEKAKDIPPIYKLEHIKLQRLVFLFLSRLKRDLDMLNGNRFLRSVICAEWRSRIATHAYSVVFIYAVCQYCRFFGRITDCETSWMTRSWAPLGKPEEIKLYL